MTRQHEANLFAALGTIAAGLALIMAEQRSALGKTALSADERSAILAAGEARFRDIAESLTEISDSLRHTGPAN